MSVYTYTCPHKHKRFEPYCKECKGIRIHVRIYVYMSAYTYTCPHKHKRFEPYCKECNGSV